MRADVADMIEDMRLMFEFEYCEECGGDFEDHDWWCLVWERCSLSARPDLLHTLRKE